MPSSFREAFDEIQRKRKEKWLAQPVTASIVIASFQKAPLLARTLDSILRQRTAFHYEVIVVDDGSTDDTPNVCQSRGVIYRRIEREPTYRNPGAARNLAYQLAKGDILICQSDDVVHETEDTIERLVNLPKGEMHFATVHNADFADTGIVLRRRECYSGHARPEPLFFLGSVWREDIYAVGACDPEFTLAGFEDTFLGDCLIKRGVKPIFRDDVSGLHQSHKRPSLRSPYRAMEAIYQKRLDECQQSNVWCSSGGSWEYVSGRNWFGHDSSDP